MSVAGKLSAALGLLLLLFGATIVFQLGATRRAVNTSYALSRIFERLDQSVGQQLDDLDRIEENASKFSAIGDPGYRGLLDDGVRAFAAELARGDSMTLDPSERRELTQMQGLWADVPVQVVELEDAVAQGDTAAASLRLTLLLDRVDELRGWSRRLGDASRAAVRQRLERSAAAQRRAEQIALAVAIGTLLLSILVAAWIVRSIAEPLRRLSEATHHVAEGRFDHRFELPGDRQFARLADDFNRMTERLAELDRMKQQFLSRTSHDLKTPLASMRETSRVLLDGVAGPLTEDQRRLLQLSQESGERLSGMIAKILELSALQAGARTLERRPVDLRSLARRAAEQCAPSFAQRHVAVAFDLPDRPVMASCEGDGILRILDNLLENAGRVSPEGATVRLAARAADRAGAASPLALLAVEDDGPGVPPEDRERIFEAFYRATPGTRGGGVGLGLAICREIAQAHEGAIWVESAPGGGSRFILALPALAPAGAPAPAPAA